MRPDKSQDRLIYFGFLTLIAWLPLPFGSNRPWAKSILEVWVCSLMLLWLIAFMRNTVQLTGVFKKATPVVSLFFYMAYLDIAAIYPTPCDLDSPPFTCCIRSP